MFGLGGGIVVVLLVVCGLALKGMLYPGYLF